MRPETIPIKALLMRTFLPAVVVIAVLLAAMVYNRLYASILDGFERKLVTASALTAAMIDPEDHDRLIAAAHRGKDTTGIEATPLYQRSARPIRRIREELGLTYLYTQILGGKADVRYVLDGTQGKDHSPLGSDDDLPDETVAGLKRVQTRGTVYVSPIEYQQQWGLLKTAAAPVLDAHGRIAGSAGADINISVIQVATQNALFHSAMIGIGSVLACLLAALTLVRRIGGPIETLTQDTLQIAGGHIPAAGPRPAPHEVKALRLALDTLTKSMTRDAACRQQEEARRNDAARAGMLSAQTSGHTESPVILIAEDRRLVVWIGIPPSNPRAVLARVAMVNLARSCAGNADIRARWRDLVDIDHGTCLLIDGAAGCVECWGSAVCHIVLGGTPHELAPGHRLEFAPGNSITLDCADRPEFHLWPQGVR